jgi:hypothetical protein
MSRAFQPAAGFLLILVAAATVSAAKWQYSVAVDREPDKRGRPRDPGEARMWIPPESASIRAILLCGDLGIENELVVAPQVRQVCRERDVAIVYFTPHLSGVFHYWESNNRAGQLLLDTLDALAKRSGYNELRCVPWITAGHSTAGIFARNVAYWKPQRTAGVIHLKSGNFHQQEHLPPGGSLAGIPLVAINGQFETFGPEGGIRPEFGRETQWRCVLADLLQFRRESGDHLMSLVVQPGADHFHGSPELAAYVAMFLAKTVEYRVPASAAERRTPVACLPLKAASGWLMDSDLYAPKHNAAPFAEYAGDRHDALWLYDREMVEATTAMHRQLDAHQVLSNPECFWLDEGDGWIFQARAEFLDTIPEAYGGSVGGQKVGHARTPFVYRAKPNEPVAQVGPDRFRLLRPTRRVHIAAFHPGDERFRATIRWGSIDMPRVKDASSQTIEAAGIADLAADSKPVRIRASSSSGAPVHFEVDYGPVVVENGRLRISEIPPRARFPISCRITAYQIGRRTPPVAAAAAPVSVSFQVVQPARD